MAHLPTSPRAKARLLENVAQHPASADRQTLNALPNSVTLALVCLVPGQRHLTDLVVQLITIGFAGRQLLENAAVSMDGAVVQLIIARLGLVIVVIVIKRLEGQVQMDLVVLTSQETRSAQELLSENVAATMATVGMVISIAPRKIATVGHADCRDIWKGVKSGGSREHGHWDAFI